MQSQTCERKTISLLAQFRRYLIVTIILLLFLLLIRFLAETLLLRAWQAGYEHAVLLQRDLTTLQQSMIDQETGLRGYIATNEEAFLDPFMQGSGLYRSSLQQFKQDLHMLNFRDSQTALALVELRATAWYTTFALVQIQDMRAGDLTGPRSLAAAAKGKALFDRFREAVKPLQATVARDLHALLIQERTRGQETFLAMMLLTLVAIAFLAFSFRRFAEELKTQLDSLQETAHQLEQGDLKAQVRDLKHRELHTVGQTLNQMAQVLRQQHQELLTRALLIERASEYWALLNTVNTALLFISPEGQVLVANHWFHHFFASTDGDIVGHSLEDLCSSLAPLFADPSGFRDALARKESGKAPEYFTLLQQIAPERRELELQTLPVSALQNHLLGYLHLLRDVTQERALTRTKSEFVSTVCHEFRTALTGIQGFSELITDQAASIQEAAEFAEEINADAIRLTRLISDLLDLERMQSGRSVLSRTSVDLNELLQEEADRMQRLSMNHSILLDLESTLPTFSLDRDKILQVVRNLCSNAVKYSPEGGEIVIRSRMEGIQLMCV